ncbi:hypothetical protein O1611_g6352 [Lasiodiplodia mahajangana]|uniref:Uncharacterized protein n=1 Tax=Lasiodiplodia mahajangana TaxID=1108764 RepID=A0ACC2JIL5_9PEZI|nr:hypothetical protein O1611_g6352 [Lasiodiplodia mahajangana]
MADAFEGASVKEQLIEACRRNNVDLLTEIIQNCKNDAEISDLMNNTTTVMGNHLYHEAALQGHYEVIDMLLDQPDVIRWINSEPPAQREFGNALVNMMLEAGSSTRVKNKAKLTPYQLVDPRNTGLRELIQKHEYAALNAGDFVGADEIQPPKANANANANSHFDAPAQEESDDDAEFSGSDDEERAEWERRRNAKKGR